MSKPIWIGWVLLSVAFGGLAREGFEAAFAHVPYRNVDIIDAHMDGENFVLTANFTKTDCVFSRLSVVGIGFDQTHQLQWKDQDDLGQGQEHDREIGNHTLRIIADTEGLELDFIEVRTRHDCDGHTVDRLFTRFQP